MKTKFWMVAGLLLLTVNWAHGQLLKNCDFERGHAFWEGGGKMVTLDEAGEKVAMGAAGKPAMEVVLSRTQPTEVHQRFLFAHGERSMKVTVLLKVSSDYTRNDSASKYSKDITWETGGRYIWPTLKYPRVDFCMRVDVGDSFHYTPRAVTPGGGWQTVVGSFKDMRSNGPKNFSMIFPAGTGTFEVKSITAEPITAEMIQ